MNRQLTSRNILIIGANSLIAQEVSRCFLHYFSCSFFLVGRHQEKLQQVKKDLQARQALRVDTFFLDALHLDQFETCLQTAFNQYKVFDYVLIAWGDLPNEKKIVESPQKIKETIDINFTHTAILCEQLCQRLSQQETRSILGVISSVAGDRSRKQLYIYGAAKAGLSAYLQGLRQKYSTSSVHIATIKPGPVDTPMTAHLKPTRLLASAEQVGQEIVRKAYLKQRDIIYTPAYWRFMMLLIKMIPEKIYKYLTLGR